MLAKEPENYTVGEILRVIEGNLAPVACLETSVNKCERHSFCPTIHFWEGLYQVVNEYVDSVTLQDLSVVPPVNEDCDYSI